MEHHDPGAGRGTSVIETDGAADGGATLEANVNAGSLVRLHVNPGNDDWWLARGRLRLYIVAVVFTRAWREITGLHGDDVIGAGRHPSEGEAAVESRLGNAAGGQFDIPYRSSGLLLCFLDWCELHGGYAGGGVGVCAVDVASDGAGGMSGGGAVLRRGGDGEERKQ